MRIRLTLPIALTMVVLSVTALVAATNTIVNVSQKSRAFSTGSLQIQRGQVVHVSNEDQFNHQIYVESASFTFESDEQEPGSSVDIPFSKGGLFEVRCHIHPKMLLNVEVH